MAEAEETQKVIGTVTVMAAEGERKKKKKALQFYRPSYKWRKNFFGPLPLSSPFSRNLFPLFFVRESPRARYAKKVAKNEAAAAGSIFLHRSPPPLLISLLFFLSPTSM